MSDNHKAIWWEWHKQNPEVYELFKKYAYHAIYAGHKNYSSKTIIERIRWHQEVETEGDIFKINNNFTAYYARLFMHEHPQYDGFFRTREAG